MRIERLQMTSNGSLPDPRVAISTDIVCCHRTSEDWLTVVERYVDACCDQYPNIVDDLGQQYWCWWGGCGVPETEEDNVVHVLSKRRGYLYEKADDLKGGEYVTIAQTYQNMNHWLAKHLIDFVSTLPMASHRCSALDSMRDCSFPASDRFHLNKRIVTSAIRKWLCHLRYHSLYHTGSDARMIDTTRWRLNLIERLVGFHSLTRIHTTQSSWDSPLRYTSSKRLGSSPVPWNNKSSSRIFRKQTQHEVSSTAHGWFSECFPFLMSMSFATMTVEHLL